MARELAETKQRDIAGSSSAIGLKGKARGALRRRGPPAIRLCA